MCDYSLCGLPNRLAIEGEELVVHKFQTGSMGLAPQAELAAQTPPSPKPPQTFWERVKTVFDYPSPPVAATAVCIPPGAQLILKGIPRDLQRRWKIGEEECVFFVETNALPHHYRDAVRLSNGTEVLLQSLQEGMVVEVLSLGGDEFAVRDEEFVLREW